VEHRHVHGGTGKFRGISTLTSDGRASAYLPSAMTAANRARGSTCSRSGTARSRARRSTSGNHSRRPRGGPSGGPRP